MFHYPLPPLPPTWMTSFIKENVALVLAYFAYPMVIIILLKTINFMIFEKILRIYSLLYPHQHHSSSLAEEKVPLLKNFPTEGGEGWGSGEVEMVSLLLPVFGYEASLRKKCLQISIDILYSRWVLVLELVVNSLSLVF